MDPHPPSLRQRAAAFSAAAWRVAAPTALTEHGWLAKLSSHTTWRERGCAHAPPAGGRRAATALSAESLGPRLDGGRDCAASMATEAPIMGCPESSGKVQKWQRMLWLD